MVVIRHTIRTVHTSIEVAIRDVLEHLRYSGSSVVSWSIEETLKVEASFRGSIIRWKQVKERAKTFLIKIDDEHRFSENTSYRPENLPKDVVRECLKCLHIWKQQTHLRHNGNIKFRCPKCNSNQTVDTHLIKTKITAREDLLMITGGAYPKKFCPRTDVEEIQGVPIDRVGKARLSVGRGFEKPTHGHKVVLINKNGFQIDTNYTERQSMMGAIAWCPPNARVFIGGLGVGLVLLYLAKTGKAREVVVCEIDPDTITIVEPRLRRWFDSHYPKFKWKIVQGDALTTVLEGEPYDWVFMDIWKTAHNIELMKKAEEVAKKNLTQRGRVTCWMKNTYEKKQRELKKFMDGA